MITSLQSATLIKPTVVYPTEIHLAARALNVLYQQTHLVIIQLGLGVAIDLPQVKFDTLQHVFCSIDLDPNRRVPPIFTNCNLGFGTQLRIQGPHLEFSWS